MHARFLRTLHLFPSTHGQKLFIREQFRAVLLVWSTGSVPFLVDLEDENRLWSGILDNTPN